MCSHIVGLIIRLGKFEVPIEAQNIIMGNRYVEKLYYNSFPHGQHSSYVSQFLKPETTINESIICDITSKQISSEYAYINYETFVFGDIFF